MTALATFLDHLRTSCEHGTFVQLGLTSPTPAAGPTLRVRVRLVALRDGPSLSFTHRAARADTTRNLPVDAGVREVERLLRGSFRGALLATTTADWQLRGDADGGHRLIRHRPATKAAPTRAHDATKATLLGAAAAPWLRGLGLLDAEGRPRRGMAGKHAQLDRYVELLLHLARDCGWHERPPDGAPLQIVDAGCGKGHLTFAAWHLVRHVLQRPVRVLGLDAREDLAAAADERARALAGGELRFAAGDIATAPLPPMDALLALHACDTATDHAIRRGVEAGASLIVVAPCCHQEVRPQLAAPVPLGPVLAHGLFAERLAEWATDGLRALVLAWAGYRTKAIEFVAGEHTPKNLLLAAVRDRRPPTPAERAQALARLDAFRAWAGIRTHALDALLAPPSPHQVHD